MRKQLIETQEIDRYLLQEMTTDDQLVFQARMIITPDLKAKSYYQQQVHSIIRWFARKEKKENLEIIHVRLMKEKTFNETINSIFR